MSDAVNHPSHYNDGRYEVIEFIEDYGVGFHVGNAIKYISRAGKKDPSKDIQDLNKAIWYLTRAKDYGETYIKMGAHRISLADYCVDKKLALHLRRAMYKIIDGAYDQAIEMIQEHIQIMLKQKAVSQNG